MQHVKIVACSALANLPFNDVDVDNTTGLLVADTFSLLAAGIVAAPILNRYLSVTKLAITAPLIDLAIVIGQLYSPEDSTAAGYIFLYVRPFVRGVAAYTLFQAFQGIVGNWSLIKIAAVAIPASVEVFGATCYSAFEQIEEYLWKS